ncbi:hypothetical protein [Halanaerobaculum tunisiense]
MKEKIERKLNPIIQKKKRRLIKLKKELDELKSKKPNLSSWVFINFFVSSFYLNRYSDHLLNNYFSFIPLDNKPFTLSYKDYILFIILLFFIFKLVEAFFKNKFSNTKDSKKKKYNSLKESLINDINNNNNFCKCNNYCNCKNELVEKLSQKYGIDLIG